ncbi:pfs domain-containing protein [Colletotrichum tabaci]|uniref:Pfs domain-containing protein n=1 Tax=Colletotrichum tabaci TaxID=1209068 RepID=A0AAV9T3Z5_9PEZI
MERSGRLFSECASEIWTTDEPSTSTVSPNVVSRTTATSELEHEHYDALDVVEASEAYQVPSVSVTHIGVSGESMGTMQFALGNGLSSQVVQHITSEETAPILPANTVLALKIFIARPVFGSSSAARESRSDVYATIVREIKVIGHPLLRGHENIAQLRFIAWSEKQPFPMLAMELGNYGTLDHIIRSRGSDSSLSSRQKQHITLDIAVGLRAIHQVGFIHGDLKPENIIVMNHANPKRGVIAKLLDFGGSSDDTQSGPAHVTPLWCAPEIEGGRKDVDWAKCDIYSYGLVIASVWGRDASDQLYSVEGLGTQLQASVLSRFNGNTPTTSETDLMTRVRKMQTSDWRDANSLVSILRNQLVTKLPSNDLDVPHLVGIILSTLHADSNMRPTAAELVDMFQPSFNRLRRDIPPDRLVHDEEAEEEEEVEEEEEGEEEEGEEGEEEEEEEEEEREDEEEDHDASELVPLAYEAGAQLDVRCEIQTTHLGIKHANISPILGSILKGRPLVALAIIALHEKINEPIVDFQASLYFASSYLFHEIVIRMLQLHKEKPWLCFEGSRRSRRWKSKSKTLSSILRFTMLKRGGHQVVEADRFAIHGESFASAKKETERLLLNSGAEPELRAVENAIFYDETDSLQLFVRHLGPSKLFGHLRTSPFQLGKLCIELGAINCFTYLLTQNIIRTTEGGDGGKLVHFATDRVPEKRDFLSALLKHGADIMTTDHRSHTTLHLAMLRRDMVAVDMLSQHCSEEQLADLLRRHPSTGRSIFADLILIQSPHFGIPFEGLQWLANRGGVHYYGGSAESWDWPVWHSIVVNPRPTTRTAQLSDAKLVEFLLGLETFSERMQAEMCAPCQELILHHAAWNGHVDIVRLLLQHNFDVNAVSENPGWAKRGLTPTMTVLELVWSRLRSGDVPAVIQAAGRLEVIKWHESLSEVVDLLVAAGASSSTFYWDRRWAVQLEVLDQQPLGSTILFNRGEAIVGSWPEPLPSATRLAGDGRTKAAKKWTDREYQLIPYFDSKSRRLSRRSEAGQEEAGDASDSDSSPESVEDGERNLPLLFWPEKQTPRDTTRALFLGGKRTPKMAGESRETLEVALAQMPRWVRTDYVEGTTTPLHIAALRNDTDTLRILLESENVPIDIGDELGLTALCLAASEGHEAAVRLLFQSGAALVKPAPTEDLKEIQALHCCVLMPFSKPSMIELLLKLGADPNSRMAAKYKRSLTVLTGCLAASDRPDIVQTLINGGASLDPFQEPEWNALATAITYNRVKSLRLLLSASTTPWRGPYGINLVHFAAHYAQYGDSVVKLLLDFAAEHPDSPHSAELELDAVDNSNMSALSYAAKAGNLAAVELLLARGANVDAVLRKGSTALFWAVRGGNPQIVKALLKKGANVHAMDEEGSQPLTSALKKKRTKDMDKVALILLEHNASFNGAITVKWLPKALSWAAMSGRLDYLRMLLDRGANVNRYSSNAGCAVLLSASEHGQLGAVRLLLERGADILAVDKNGRSAMSVAMDSGHRDVVTLLVTRGADLNSRTENGGTALFWAASNGFLDTGKLLVERGQDINAVDEEGETALFAAALKGHGGFVNFLLDRGADVNHRNNNASTVIIRMVDCIAQDTRLPTNLGREVGEVAALN